MAQIVQPDHRQGLLAQRLARSCDLAGEAAGEPLRMPMVDVEFAQHERGVPDEVDGRSVGGRSGVLHRGGQPGTDHRHSAVAGVWQLPPGLLYLAGAAVLSVVAVLLSRETAHGDLTQDPAADRVTVGAGRS